MIIYNGYHRSWSRRSEDEKKDEVSQYEVEQYEGELTEAEQSEEGTVFNSAPKNGYGLANFLLIAFVVAVLMYLAFESTSNGLYHVYRSNEGSALYEWVGYKTMLRP